MAEGRGLGSPKTLPGSSRLSPPWFAHCEIEASTLPSIGDAFLKFIEDIGPCLSQRCQDQHVPENDAGIQNIREQEDTLPAAECADDGNQRSLAHK